MEAPKVDITTAQELLRLSQLKALEKSDGRLKETSPNSPVTAILEATSIVASAVINRVNELASTLEATRLSYFGIERELGTSSIGTIEVNLDALYAEPFLIPVGFRFLSNGIQFQTTQEINISPYSTRATASCVSLSVGISTNVAVTSSIIFSPIPRVAGIKFIEAPVGGRDAESEEQWKERILGTLRRRDTLMSEEDFEVATVQYLGVDSVAVAIGRLKPDKATYDNGYVGVFGLNPDGTQLSDAQKTALGARLNQKASMAQITVWSIETFIVNVDAVVGFINGANPELLAPEIKSKINQYFVGLRTAPGDLVLNKAIENRIMDVTGVVEGVVSVKLNGLAQPCTLPNRWTVAVMKDCKITLVNNGREFSF